MSDLKLNGKIFKILSSPTRRSILKKLSERNKTVTELAEEHGIEKSAILKHIDLMLEEVLIYRRENSNKFIYYGLTDKGREIVCSTEKVEVSILLTTGLLTFLGGIAEVYTYVRRFLSQPRPPEIPVPPNATPRVPPMVPTVPQEIPKSELIIGIVLITVAVVLFYYMFKKHRSILHR
jgi:DNA-binding transcriptional ArsR family regulator